MATSTGWWLYHGLSPALALAKFVGAPSLEKMLLSRHLIMDYLVSDAIESGLVEQVLELASGLSPRGLRFVDRFPQLSYVESDLPKMAFRKSHLLESHSRASEKNANPLHRVVALDILKSSGENSLEGVLDSLDPSKGTAVISEGLVNYFPRAQVETLWARIATGLRSRSGGLYLSDLHTGDDIRGALGAQAFITALEIFARGNVSVEFQNSQEVELSLAQAGFTDSSLLTTKEFASLNGVEEPYKDNIVRIVRAQV